MRRTPAARAASIAVRVLAERGLTGRRRRDEQELLGSFERVGQARRVVVVAPPHPDAAALRGRSPSPGRARSPRSPRRAPAEQAFDDGTAELAGGSGNNDHVIDGNSYLLTLATCGTRRGTDRRDGGRAAGPGRAGGRHHPGGGHRGGRPAAHDLPAVRRQGGVARRRHRARVPGLPGRQGGRERRPGRRPACGLGSARRLRAGQPGPVRADVRRPPARGRLACGDARDDDAARARRADRRGREAPRRRGAGGGARARRGLWHGADPAGDGGARSGGVRAGPRGRAGRRHRRRARGSGAGPGRGRGRAAGHPGRHRRRHDRGARAAGGVAGPHRGRGTA